MCTAETVLLANGQCPSVIYLRETEPFKVVGRTQNISMRHLFSSWMVKNADPGPFPIDRACYFSS